MKKFITYFILLFAILVGAIFAQSSQELPVRRIDRAMLESKVVNTGISTPHTKAFSFVAVDVTVEDSTTSTTPTMRDGIILFLSLAFTIGLVVFTNHDWSNRFVSLNKSIAEKMIPKYLLYHSMKLYA